MKHGRARRAARTTVLSSLALLGVVLLAVGLWSMPTKDELLVEEPSETVREVSGDELHQPVDRPAPETPPLRLTSFEGLVEIRRGGEDVWAAARPGAALDPADSIRTAPGATAELVAGDHVVRLLPVTDVRLEELTADLSRFLLGKGMLAAQADSGDGPRRLQVDVAGTDVTASTEGGRFRVSSSLNGVVAVGAEEGRVTVAARGREVVLRGGEGTLVRPGGAPDDPAPLPESLLLRVAWPEELETNRTSLRVAGRTAEGALIFVAGRPVAVDEEGRFAAEVSLRDGVNRVTIEGYDVAGNQLTRRSPAIVVDRRGTRAEFDTKSLWD